MGISLPRTVSNTDSCLIPHKLCRCRIPENLAPPDFLIPSLDQRSPFADWTVSPRCIPVNRGFSVSAIGYKTGFNINSPATGIVDASADVGRGGILDFLYCVENGDIRVLDIQCGDLRSTSLQLESKGTIPGTDVQCA